MDKNILTYDLSTRIFPDMAFEQKNREPQDLEIYPAKTNKKIFGKLLKTPFLVHFGPSLPILQKNKNFPEKSGSSTFETLMHNNFVQF